MKKLIPTLLLITVCVHWGYAQDKLETSDHYISGYIRALLSERYDCDITVQVRNGEVFIGEEVAGHSLYENILEDIYRVNGVHTIKISPPNQMRRIGKAWVLPHEPLFKPLLADPKWARISTSYTHFSSRNRDKNGLRLNLGHTFPLLREGLGESKYSEIGIQAGVFSLFDMDTGSLDLVNADYIIGLPVTYQWDSLTVMLRLYHQGSHTGDDYLRRNSNAGNKSFNFQAVDSIISFEPTDWFRLYAGGGIILNANPGSFDRLMYQSGLEIRVVPDNPSIPVTIAALDIKGYQQTGYVPGWSARLGMEITRRTVVSLDIYDGYSQDGRFYNERTTCYGIGINFY